MTKPDNEQLPQEIPLIEGTGFYSQNHVDSHVAEAKEHLAQFPWKGVELYYDADPKLERIFPGEQGTHYGVVGTEIPLSETFAGKGVDLLTPVMIEKLNNLPRQERLKRMFDLLRDIDNTPENDDVWCIYAHPDDIQAGGMHNYLYWKRCRLMSMQAEAVAMEHIITETETDEDIRTFASYTNNQAATKHMSVNHLVMYPGTGGANPALTENTNPIARIAALTRACQLEGSTAIYMPYSSKEPITDDLAKEAVLAGKGGNAEWMGFKTDNHRKMFAMALTRTFPMSTTISHEGPPFDIHTDHGQVYDFMSHIKKYGPWTKYNASVAPDNRPYKPEGQVRHFGIRVWSGSANSRPSVEIVSQPDNPAVLLGMAGFRQHNTEALSYAAAVYGRDASYGMWSNIDPVSPNLRAPLSEDAPPVTELSLETSEARMLLQAHWDEMQEKGLIPEFHFENNHRSDGTAYRIHSPSIIS